MDAPGLNVMKSSFNVKDLLDLPSEPKSLSPVAVTIGVNHHYNSSDVTAAAASDEPLMTVTQLENATSITDSSSLVTLSENNKNRNASPDGWAQTIVR